MDAAVFSFGVIADVQYCDEDNGWDFHRTKERFYRLSRDAMYRAARSFAAAKVDFVLQLGDLIDGQCVRKGRSAETLRTLAIELEQQSGAAGPVLHCCGNHELYCMSKAEALAQVGAPAWYHSYSPLPGWKIVVLDSYGFSTLDKATEADAYEFLRKRNPNDVRHSVDWVAGLIGPQRRFVPYNGALGVAQLQWLKRELDEPDVNVIIATHVPMAPESCAPECLLWDYEEAMEVVSAARSHVVAVLAGHDHDGGYTIDAHGVHHVTLQSPMTAPNLHCADAHAIAKVFHNRIELAGAGTVPSRTLHFN